MSNSATPEIWILLHSEASVTSSVARNSSKTFRRPPHNVESTIAQEIKSPTMGGVGRVIFGRVGPTNTLSSSKMEKMPYHFWQLEWQPVCNA